MRCTRHLKLSVDFCSNLAGFSTEIQRSSFLAPKSKRILSNTVVRCNKFLVFRTSMVSTRSIIQSLMSQLANNFNHFSISSWVVFLQLSTSWKDIFEILCGNLFVRHVHTYITFRYINMQYGMLQNAPFTCFVLFQKFLIERLKLGIKSYMFCGSMQGTTPLTSVQGYSICYLALQ